MVESQTKGMEAATMAHHCLSWTRYVLALANVLSLHST
jgi:hypothetical protein